MSSAAPYLRSLRKSELVAMAEASGLQGYDKYRKPQLETALDQHLMLNADVLTTGGVALDGRLSDYYRRFFRPPRNSPLKRAVSRGRPSTSRASATGATATGLERLSSFGSPEVKNEVDATKESDDDDASSPPLQPQPAAATMMMANGPVKSSPGSASDPSSSLRSPALTTPTSTKPPAAAAAIPLPPSVPPSATTPATVSTPAPPATAASATTTPTAAATATPSRFRQSLASLLPASLPASPVAMSAMTAALDRQTHRLRAGMRARVSSVSAGVSGAWAAGTAGMATEAGVVGHRVTDATGAGAHAVQTRAEAVRGALSSGAALNAVVLLVEFAALVLAIVPLHQARVVVPTAIATGGSVVPMGESLLRRLTPMFAEDGSMTVGLVVPKSTVLGSGTTFWAPLSLWFLTSVVLPVLVGYFVNIERNRASASAAASGSGSQPVVGAVGPTATTTAAPSPIYSYGGHNHAYATRRRKSTLAIAAASVSPEPQTQPTPAPAQPSSSAASLAPSIDPFVASIAKAVIACWVYAPPDAELGAASGTVLCGLYSVRTAERVVAALPAGLAGLLASSGIGVLVALYEAVLRR